MTDDGRPDHQLLTAASAGDDAAFGLLVRRYIRPATLLATQLLGDPDDADDVVQDTFRVVHRDAASFRVAEPFAPWLYGILRRLAANRRIRAHRRLRLMRRWASELLFGGAVPAPDAAVIAGLEVARVLEQTARLSPMQRACFELVALRGVSTADAAAMHGISESTVRQHLFRARLALGEHRDT